jgi:hypothetical protein
MPRQIESESMISQINQNIEIAKVLEIVKEIVKYSAYGIFSSILIINMFL